MSPTLHPTRAPHLKEGGMLVISPTGDFKSL